MKNISTISIIVLVVIAGFLVVQFITRDNFQLPKGESVKETEVTNHQKTISEQEKQVEKDKALGTRISKREVFVTDGVRHSIPLNEILSGGPPKDGIPSIDNPQFISSKEADEFLDDTSPGLGVEVGSTQRFYPYQILVWHEIVNDSIEGMPILVTYCPLCLTGIVFERVVDGKAVAFGVSGKLWKSNLLMYDRAGSEENESLWSQVLGEAVLGVNTSTKLTIMPSDTVTYSSWKKKHPQTEVLSKDTGVARTYGRDPYGSYYTDDTVSFGATFNDSRLHPKEFVLGVEVEGLFKAYHTEALEEGTITDTFNGHTVIIKRDTFGGVRMFVGDEDTPLPYIGGFWFSWLAVHPETGLFTK